MVAKKEASGLSCVFANTYTYYSMALNLYKHPELSINQMKTLELTSTWLY